MRQPFYLSFVCHTVLILPLFLLQSNIPVVQKKPKAIAINQVLIPPSTFPNLSKGSGSCKDFYMGIGINREASTGIITAVGAGTPADKAGIKVNDIMLILEEDNVHITFTIKGRKRTINKEPICILKDPL